MAEQILLQNRDPRGNELHGKDYTTILPSALHAARAGLSVVPPKMDGSKAPLGDWRQYQNTGATEAQIHRWYDDEVLTGIGLVTGNVSGNLELFEFDDRDAYLAFVEAAKAAGLDELVRRIEAGYLEESPKPGIHWLYRCDEIGGNTKLAKRTKTTEEMKHPKDNLQVLIETRGKGGYVVIAPSHGKVHPSGLPYRLLSGGFDTIASITPEERRDLFDLARTFDRSFEKESQNSQVLGFGDPLRPGDRPGDQFNAQADWRELLEAQGWDFVQRRGECDYWRRPGKKQGISASTNWAGKDYFYCLSTSTDFEAEKPYDKFGFYALVMHGGDVKAATKALGAMGYGQEFEIQAWPSPQLLAAKIEPVPYPLDAFPDTIRAAVLEVLGFVKAPVPLVASSALAALSIAAQAHIDAKRAEKLQGPVGLFLLTIADSGERKSTCDGFFTKPIRDYEESQAVVYAPILKDYKAEIGVWEAKQSGIKDKIRQLAKDRKPTVDMESALRDLEHGKPEPPRIPRLLYTDATPEALAFGLAKQWPSAAVISAEAGIVFGSHGMGKDSIMRNLGLLNQLWDGTSLTIDRRTSENFTVKDSRLTVALQIQEATLRNFFDRSGGLARGSGFLARFLVACSESTQGFRPFTEAPPNWPHLAVFHTRIAAILDQPVPINDDGSLTPTPMTMTPEAKKAWIDFHDAIESELISGGELYDVRDVASKTADNAVRLAALFQMFEYGIGEIRLDCFEAASRIAAWHLNESRRFFGELALPAELADAVRLDSWLIEYCRKGRMHFVGKNHVRQHGPIRDGARLDAAIRELAELDRLRLEKDGKRLTININPALVGVAR